MSDSIGWGLLATGKIARAFAADLHLVPGARLAAVGSRSPVTAQAFADEFGVARAHGSYQALADDDTVDVVYVASPHGLHYEHVGMLLDAGKNVLCEKSLVLNQRQARDLFDRAQSRGLFLMEAMWMACHPLVRELLRLTRAGDFGIPRQVRADLGFVVTAPPSDRLLAPDLGGGALLDMGVYPLTLAHLFLGEPEALSAQAGLSPDGVDLDVAISGRYAGGALAALTASMTSNTPRHATIGTDHGVLEIPADFHRPTHALWRVRGRSPRRIDPPEPVIGAGYAHEAIEVMRCLRAGETTSPWVPPEQTLALLGQMDRIRSLIGVRYPGEHA